MKIEIELDDLATDAIQDIIDAMEPDRAEAEKDLSNAESVTKEYMAILRNSKHLSDEDYKKADEDAEESIDSMTSKIEPAIVLCASLLVGVILISVMLPLMNIMSAIG